MLCNKYNEMRGERAERRVSEQNKVVDQQLRAVSHGSERLDREPFLTGCQPLAIVFGQQVRLQPKQLLTLSTLDNKE